MAKVTGKYQVTLPKTVVDRCHIRVGEELQFYTVGESIKIGRSTEGKRLGTKERLVHFDQSTARQARRQLGQPSGGRASTRGWKREDLYTRGRAR